MKRSSLYSAVALACGLALGGTAQAEMASGDMLANTCAGCHGTHGNSMGPASPTIAGISKDYFIESMAAYKSGERASTIMGRIAKGYSDEEIAAMATVFAAQEFKPGAQMADAAVADKGAKIHEKYCEKCHAEGGTSAEDDSGILAGQWVPYLQHAMDDFTNERREMPKKMGKQLEKMLEKHGDAGMKELLEFYASRK